MSNEDVSNKNSSDIKNLFSDIINSKNLNEALMDDKECKDINLSISSSINQTADTLRTINSIKDELCKLPLSPCELEYFNNNIATLLSILYQLSTISLNLSSSANFLTNSSVVHPKRSEIKDTIHLVYNLNEECEDIYDVLKKRINFLLKNDE